MSPDEINKTLATPAYRCRVCRVDNGLHWYGGTSCPVCNKPECIEEVQREFKQAWDEYYEQDHYGY